MLLVLMIPMIIIGWMVSTTLIRNHVNSKIPHPYTAEFDYTKKSFFYDLKETFWNGWVMQRKLIVDMRFYMRTPDILKPNVKPIKSLECKEYWTDLSKADIHQRGYLPVERLHDTLAWVRVKTYLRFDNPQRFEVPKDKDKDGHFVYSQDTPSTLYDKWRSNATKEFIKNMSKLGMREMDTQTIIMIGIVAVGAVAGMWLLGII